MAVSYESHLSGVVVGVVLEVLVLAHGVNDVHKGLEEGFVVALVERACKLLQVGNISDDGKDVRGVNDLFLQDFAIQPLKHSPLDSLDR